jgi:two-component system, OmpR family, response regulator
VPVIVTTGRQLDEAGLVLAFELGADSYMIKPFGLRELLARLKAIFRRQEMGRLMLERAPIHARAALRQALLNAWHESLQE